MEKELTRKEKQITELYLETTLSVGKNADNWISFLKRASYNYKYRFDEQILIYAQRPDAVAVAETEIWNKKLKRWVNKGSKGIALITEREGRLGLRFVFDVADTNSNVYGRKLKLWTAEEKYSNDIIEALENKFGEMENKDDLPLAIISTVFNYVSENIQDYLEDLKSVKANSKLETLEEKELEDKFKELIMFSTIALVMSRCGLDINYYIPKGNFATIENFNTFETMSILGTATRDFSKEILLEISNTIINLQKQEKKKNYTFEINKIKNYDKENEKGSVKNEYNLQRTRGLSNTRPNNSEETNRKNENRQIRENEVTIPKREQEGNLHNVSGEQQIDRPLDTNRTDSYKENKPIGRANETTIWNNRGNESEQPNGMGRADEQHSSNSRTDSSKGTNLQLEEKKNEKEVDNTSFFDDKTIRNILENSPNVIKDKVNFGNFIYENNEDKEKCKKYIKEVLGNAYTEFEVDNERVGYKANEDSLNIWRGNYLNRIEECFKDWDTITKYCIANNVHYAIPKYNQDIYTFKVGDIIYLGLQEFTIIDINNENITMYDNEFPLDRRTVTTKDIVNKIAENPMNDYLKERKLTEEKQESAFDKWIDTFVVEKGIDLQKIIEVKTENNTHYFEVGNIIENIKSTTAEEQAGIKDMIVKIDFHNGNVLDYFKHLARALAEKYDKQQEQKDRQKNEKEEQIEETKEQETVAEKLIKKNSNRNIEYFDLHPEIPTEERNNFKITDDNLGVGTVKEKYKNNVEAIKVLKKCEEQNRYATPEEQEILSKYVGWGGLKSAFEDKNDSWANEYAELKELLTEDEYKDARASSVTAYYTPPVVIRNIYKALQNMGLKQANILEPSCRCR